MSHTGHAGRPRRPLDRLLDAAAAQPLATATLGLVFLTIVLTWPQARFMATGFAAHQDSYFSTWRIAWIAHALTTSPAHLFDGNIFTPLPRAMALSDATMLEGVIGAPLFWIGLPGVAIYNLLLLGAIAASGVAMFVLARHLTGSSTAAFVGAAIFTLAPYRIEHFMHLELQWTMWMPLAFWAAHRTVHERSWRFGLLTGLFVWLQLMSGIYYGVYLGMVLAVYCLLSFAAFPKLAPAAAVALAGGAVMAGILVFPYTRPYVENARELGPRDLEDIRVLSATAWSYLCSPSQNLLWGWTADRYGHMETRLFPGLVAIALATVGLSAPSRRQVAIWVGVCAAAVALSFGLNGPVYRFLYNHIWALGAFRAPSRFGILVMCAVAVLAAYGMSILERRAVNRSARVAFTFGFTVLLMLECWSAPMVLVGVKPGVPDVYKVLRTMPQGVVLELPIPKLDNLPFYDPEFEFWSTLHWRPIVNGYSGHFPPMYAETIVKMANFPDSLSVGRLRQLGVRQIIVHESLYAPTEIESLLYEMTRRPLVFSHAGRYRDWNGWADIFELK